MFIINQAIKILLVNFFANVRTKISSAYDPISTNLASSVMQFNWRRKYIIKICSINFHFKCINHLTSFMFTLASSHVTSSRPNQYSEFMNTVHPKIKVFFRQTRVNVFLRTLTVLSAWITFSHCALVHFKQITRIRFPINGAL